MAWKRSGVRIPSAPLWYGFLVAEIYVLFEPGTRKPRYVGCARNAVIRRNDHWRQRNSTYRNPVKDWLRSLKEPPELYILQTVPDEWGIAAEAYWTKLLREIPSVNLLNILDGREWREDSRQQIRESMTGKKLSAETRKKLGYAKKGKPLSEDHKSAVKRARETPESRRKSSEAAKEQHRRNREQKNRGC